MGIISGKPQGILSQAVFSCPKIDPVDLATLILRYFERCERLRQRGVMLDKDRPVIPSSDTIEPSGSSDVPGRRAIGQISSESPAREYTYGHVYHALEMLKLEQPDEYQVLRNELGPPVLGNGVSEEWRAIVGLVTRTRDYYYSMMEASTPEGKEVCRKRYKAVCDDALRQAEWDMLRLTDRVLAAAERLNQYLPRIEEAA